ncbi:MAG: HAMP domain-containing protein [Deltaproteobacteria bacterium]|nr:HAMP domain-containing protein [Deltaproteobacteria bacterium]
MQNGTLLAETLGHTTRVGIFSENSAQLQSQAAGVLRQQHVLGVTFHTASGRLLHQAKKEGSPPAMLPEPTTPDSRAASGRMSTTASERCVEYDKTFVFRAPVYPAAEYSPANDPLYGEHQDTERGALLGYVTITIDKKPLLQQLQKLLMASLLLGSAFLVICAFVTFHIVGRATRPLTKLTAEVTAVGRGDRYERVPVETDDEIGKLAEAFNIMADSIRERETALQDSKRQIHDLNRLLIRSQETERRKLSLDLHDTIAQELSLIKINFDLLFGAQQMLPKKVREELPTLTRMLLASINSVRNLSYALHPPEMDHLGLTQSVQRHCESFSKQTGIEVDFSCTGMDSVTLDFDTKTNLFRIVQEALNNVRKHASATCVTIKLSRSHPSIILRIKDDGAGFDVTRELAKAHKKKRMGLRSMTERTALLDGAIDITSTAGRGTNIVIKISCREKSNGEQTDNLFN